MNVKMGVLALMEWSSWLGHHSIHQNVVGSIPGQGTQTHKPTVGQGQL